MLCWEGTKNQSILDTGGSIGQAGKVRVASKLCTMRMLVGTGFDTRSERDLTCGRAGCAGRGELAEVGI